MCETNRIMCQKYEVIVDDLTKRLDTLRKDLEKATTDTATHRGTVNKLIAADKPHSAESKALCDSQDEAVDIRGALGELEIQLSNLHPARGQEKGAVQVLAESKAELARYAELVAAHKLIEVAARIDAAHETLASLYREYFGAAAGMVVGGVDQSTKYLCAVTGTDQVFNLPTTGSVASTFANLPKIFRCDPAGPDPVSLKPEERYHHHKRLRLPHGSGVMVTGSHRGNPNDTEVLRHAAAVR